MPSVLRLEETYNKGRKWRYGSKRQCNVQTSSHRRCFSFVASVILVIVTFVLVNHFLFLFCLLSPFVHFRKCDRFYRNRKESINPSVLMFLIEVWTVRKPVSGKSGTLFLDSVIKTIF